MFFRLFVDNCTCFDSSSFKLLQILGVKSYLSLYGKTRRTHVRNLRYFTFSQSQMRYWSVHERERYVIIAFIWIILRKFDIILSRSGSSCFSRCFRTTDTFDVMRLTFSAENKLRRSDEKIVFGIILLFYVYMYITVCMLYARKKLMFHKFIEC